MADHHADVAHDYVHGQMEIAEQAKTWAVFKVLAKWSTLGVSVLLFFLTLWFCVGTGFLGAAVASVAVLAIGIVVLKAKPEPAH